MTVWVLADGDVLGADWYATEDDALDAAEPGQEPAEIEVTPQSVAVCAPWILQ